MTSERDAAEASVEDVFSQDFAPTCFVSFAGGACARLDPRFLSPEEFEAAGALRTLRFILPALGWGATLMFTSVTWFLLTSPSHSTTPGLLIAVWMASLWMLLGPALMALGETWVQKLLYHAAVDASLFPFDDWSAVDPYGDRGAAPAGGSLPVHLPLIRCDATGYGDDLSRSVKQIREVDRLRRPVSWGFAVATASAFWLGQPWIERMLVGEVGQGSKVLGVALFFLVGMAAGDGVWGVIKTLTLVRVLSHLRWPWEPFEPRQLLVVEDMLKYSYLTALIFSSGALFVPLIWQFERASDARPVDAIAWVGLATISVGSILLLTVPYMWVRALEHRQRNFQLRSFARVVGLERMTTATAVTEPHLAVWQAAKDEPTTPFYRGLLLSVKMLSAVVLPIGLAILALAGGK